MYFSIFSEYYSDEQMDCDTQPCIDKEDICVGFQKI